MRRAVVVGGGISGLAIARELRARGVEPLVLESERRAGGKIRSERAGGWLVEHGPSAILARDPAVLELVRALGLEERLAPVLPGARSRCLAVRGRLERLPRGPVSFLCSPLLSARGKLRLLGDLFAARGPSALGEDESVAAFARRRFGRGVAERIFAPLVSGVFAGDAAQLSLPAAFPALADLEREHRSLIAGALHGGRPPAGPRMFSFPDGVEELVGALARDLGDALRAGTRVEEIARRGDAFALSVAGPGGDRETVEAEAVLLAAPAHAAATLARGLDEDLAAALGAIPYAPVALVELGYASAALRAPLDAFGFLVPPGERLDILGAVFSSSVFERRAPAGHVLISTRLGGVGRPELVGRSDAELVAVAHGDLARVLGLGAAPTFARVVRHERAIPQYTLGHRERVARVRAAEARVPGLFVGGNALEGPGIPDCIRAAGPRATALARHLERALAPAS